MKSALAPFLALAFVACSSTSSGLAESSAQRNEEIQACGLENDDSVTADLDADIHGCDPGDTQKTTICHVPPGNPANMHTICVGNAAVSAHIDHHHDTIGECPSEPPCGDDGGGSGSGSGSGSSSGSGSDPGPGSGSGSDGGVIM